MEEDDLRHEVCQVQQVPGLYITDWVGAASVNEANILSITHILSILSAEELDRYGPDETKGVELRHLDIKDDASSNVFKHLPGECQWLESTLAKPDARVIVHCQQGVSRSVAVVAGYLMKKLNMSYAEAMKEIKKTRSIVNLNPAFVDQLRDWEHQLRSDNGQDMPMSPKSPVNVITPVDVIDFVEALERSKQ